MARQINRLSALGVAKLKRGQHADGGGLYLTVTHSGSRSWTFRFMLNARAREMGFGSASTVSLADARKKAAEARQLLANGVDPIEQRLQFRRAQLKPNSAQTFCKCAENYIAAHRVGWRNEKHSAQWTSTLETYVYPLLGELPVSEIDTGLVMQVLEPIWGEKIETAKRIRGRIESVLAWATVRSFREGANPAQWKNHLDHLLPPPNKVRRVVHHPSLDYRELPAFYQLLRHQAGAAAGALEFLILTAARTSEVLGATWTEVDFANKAWVIPAERMKGGREHRVPLSEQAVRVLERVRSSNGTHVFQGRTGQRLSNMAMLTLLRRMNFAHVTAHGFRATFRSWTAEQTNVPREVAEAALAHVIESKVEAAYRRTDLYEKRRRLMDAWANFVAEARNDDVVLLRRPA